MTLLWPLCDPHELQHTRLPCPSPSPKSAQTLVHWVSNAIQPSHPLLSSSPPALSFSQHQDLFHGVSSLYHMAQVPELQFQHHSFQWRFKFDFLQDSLVWSSCRPGDSQESSPAQQFESINYLAISLLYGPTLTSVYDLKNHIFYMYMILKSIFLITPCYSLKLCV